jgi:aspartate kinase
MKVLKFGGTSVGSPERMHALVPLIRSDKPVIVVLSAVSGTTNDLVKISDLLTEGKKAEADAAISGLEKKYDAFVNELYSTDKVKTKGRELIKAHFDFIRSFNMDLFTIHEERAILAQGELLSTSLFHFFLEEQSIKSVLLPALNFMRIDEDGEPDLSYISRELKKELSSTPNDTLFITQGYICRNVFGEIDNLKRGGSDYSASLIGAAIEAEEIQIWTDIDGMHNNDPRYVEGTYPIAELSFDEAAELAYFGAKILHPSSVLPAKLKNIPVRLLNTMQPLAHGTVITSRSTDGTYKAVAAKDGITAIKIKSTRMLLAYGFLRSIFEVFERYKTPIDMITTSEVAVSITVDNPSHLDEITTELKQFGNVEIDKDQTIICVVGYFAADKEGHAIKIFESLKSIPIRMISYGGSENNISLLINTKDKISALKAINEGVFRKAVAND